MTPADQIPQAMTDTRLADPAFRRTLITHVADTVIGHAEELTALDQAIGDGDHGVNMKRGFEAVLADIDKTAALPLPDGLKAIGMALIMKVGGASGPLYGTLFVALGKALPPEPTRADLADALGSAIEAVKARGKSDTGMKTMLDVLVPVRDALASGGDVRAAANGAAAATVDVKALRGRASFLGDRSIGHMDPGSRSAALMVGAVADVMEGQR